jgi:hypothetical protein
MNEFSWKKYGRWLVVSLQKVHVSIAIRWFAGYGLYEKLPEHSSLTPIRRRSGEARFRRLFKCTVEACLNAKIATVVHNDASLIRTNGS